MTAAAASKSPLPAAAVPCSPCLWSGKAIQMRWSQTSSAADCSCSAWRVQPAGPTSEGQLCTCIQLTAKNDPAVTSSCFSNHSHVKSAVFSSCKHFCSEENAKLQSDMWDLQHSFGLNICIIGVASFQCIAIETGISRLRVDHGR